MLQCNWQRFTKNNCAENLITAFEEGSLVGESKVADAVYQNASKAFEKEKSLYEKDGGLGWQCSLAGSYHLRTGPLLGLCQPRR